MLNNFGPQIFNLCNIIVFSSEQPYLELAVSYGTGKVAELETFIRQHRERFQNVSIVVRGGL